MKILSEYCVVVLLTISTISMSDYESFSQSLSKHSGKIYAAAGLLDRGAIYSDKIVKSSFFIPENIELWEAGRDFVNFLEDNKSDFDDLETNEWLKAAEELLEFDNWNAQKIAWGNLVIKCEISNFLMRSMYVRLTNNPSEETYAAITGLIIQLQRRLPSEKAMYAIFLRYYDYDVPFEVERLDYVGLNLESSGEDPLEIKARLTEVLRATESARMQFKEIQTVEFELRKEMEGHHIKFYETPAPLILSAFAEYREKLWDIHLYVLLNQKVNREEVDWSSISETDVLIVMDDMPKGSRFWMSRDARFFLDNKYGVERVFLKKIHNDGGVSKLRESWDDSYKKKHVRSLGNSLNEEH